MCLFLQMMVRLLGAIGLGNAQLLIPQGGVMSSLEFLDRTASLSFGRGVENALVGSESERCCIARKRRRNLTHRQIKLSAFGIFFASSRWPAHGVDPPPRAELRKQYPLL